MGDEGWQAREAQRVRERKAATFKRWHELNKEKNAATRKAWRVANPNKVAASKKRYREVNKEKVAERKKRWYGANKSRVITKVRAREQRMFICSFAHERDAINAFYAACPPGHHVDHIWPLSKGGLHCLANLQYLPSAENDSKGASWDGTYDNKNWRNV